MPILGAGLRSGAESAGVAACAALPYTGAARGHQGAGALSIGAFSCIAQFAESSRAPGDGGSSRRLCRLSVSPVLHRRCVSAEMRRSCAFFAGSRSQERRRRSPSLWSAGRRPLPPPRAVPQRPRSKHPRRRRRRQRAGRGAGCAALDRTGLRPTRPQRSGWGRRAIAPGKAAQHALSAGKTHSRGAR